MHGSLVIRQLKDQLLERPSHAGCLPVRLWGLGVNWEAHVCVFESWSVQKLSPEDEAGCGLRGSYAQVPATGKTGIQEQLLSSLLQCLTPAAGGIHTGHVCMCISQ